MIYRYDLLAKLAVLAVGALTCTALTAAPADPSTTVPPAGTTAAPPAHPAPAQKKQTPSKPAKLVDINSASRAQLKTLPGIGDDEAAKIIAGRPWLTKADLVMQQVIPEGVYVSIKNRIVARQSGKPVHK